MSIFSDAVPTVHVQICDVPGTDAVMYTYIHLHYACLVVYRCKARSFPRIRATLHTQSRHQHHRESGKVWEVMASKAYFQAIRDEITAMRKSHQQMRTMCCYSHTRTD